MVEGKTSDAAVSTSSSKTGLAEPDRRSPLNYLDSTFPGPILRLGLQWESHSDPYMSVSPTSPLASTATITPTFPPLVQRSRSAALRDRSSFGARVSLPLTCTTYNC